MKDTFIEKELQWLAEIIAVRLKLYFNQECNVKDIHQILPPSLNEQTDSAYARFILSHQMDFNERLLLLLAWVPYLKPQLLDCFQVKNTDTGQRFVEFGCVDGGRDGIVRPTLATALFLLAADNVSVRMELAAHFTRHRFFASSAFFQKDETISSASFANWVINPSEELLDQVLFGRMFVPGFSSRFPATLITTNRTWDDLVLDNQTMQQVDEIKMWVRYGEKIRTEWGLADKLKPGYRVLFYGPSGSGKTFTATLIGKEVCKPVFSIDLSMVVSKYIGETEKNLATVFQMAEDKDWILFFDEADALFGKRTNIKDSHDRYANQEVAYLLQRVENYRGLVILSTNQKANIDEAFARRFQMMVRFNIPDVQERERLWRNTFSSKCVFEENLDLHKVAEDYEISGGSILNVVQYCSLLAVSRAENVIRLDDLISGIRKEFAKVGKILK